MKRAFTRNPSTWISRLLILTMVLALLVGTFAGCRKQEADPSDEPDTPPGLLTDESKDPTDGQTEPEGETDPTGTEPVVIQDNIATITAEQVSVRAAPSSESTVIGTLVKGDKVEIVDQQTLLGVTWGKLADKKGWIPMDMIDLPGGFVAPTEPEEPDETSPDETKPEETKPDETKPADNKDDNKTNNKGNGNTTVVARGIVTASELNIRSKAGVDGDRVGSLTAGARVEILEKSGGWGRIDKGWISLDYVYQDGTTGKNTAKGVVTGNQLNVRSGPGTNYGRVSSLNTGDRVNILEQFTIGGTKWGCIDKGWISLDYVYIDGTTGENSGTGTVTGNDLNIRTGPGTTYGTNGSLNKGDTVKILTQIKVGNTIWGCIDKGWISMDYVEMD